MGRDNYPALLRKHSVQPQRGKHNQQFNAVVVWPRVTSLCFHCAGRIERTHRAGPAESVCRIWANLQRVISGWPRASEGYGLFDLEASWNSLVWEWPGFGFVYYEENDDGEEAAQNAISALSNSKIHNTAIKCRFGKKMPNRKRQKRRPRDNYAGPYYGRGGNVRDSVLVFFFYIHLLDEWKNVSAHAFR